MRKKYICEKNFNFLWEVFTVNVNCAGTLASHWQGALGLWDEMILPLSCS